jgi:hypothetical protein
VIHAMALQVTILYLMSDFFISPSIVTDLFTKSVTPCTTCALNQREKP